MSAPSVTALWERIANHPDDSFAMLVSGSGPRLLKLDAPGRCRLDKLLCDGCAELIGVYDYRAQRQWLEEDVAWATARLGAEAAG